MNHYSNTTLLYSTDLKDTIYDQNNELSIPELELESLFIFYKR